MRFSNLLEPFGIPFTTDSDIFQSGSKIETKIANNLFEQFTWDFSSKIKPEK